MVIKSMRGKLIKLVFRTDFLFFLTVICIGLPFCNSEITREGLTTSCYAINPVIYFLNPQLSTFNGVEQTVLGRFDLILINYIINSFILLPLLFVFKLIGILLPRIYKNFNSISR